MVTIHLYGLALSFLTKKILFSVSLNLEKNILSKNGVFLLEFADLASIIKNKMFDTMCHEHLEYYSTKVILDLCKKNGLVVFDIKKNNINGSKQLFVRANN